MNGARGTPPGTVVRRTARLIIRHLNRDDGDALHAVYSDAEAMRWVGDGRPLDRADCERWIGITLGNYRSRGYGMYAIEHAQTGRVVGFCGLVHPGGQPEVEAKYALRRDCWGQGLATEALGAMLAHGFETLGLTQIIATTAPDNTASHRVLRKAGFHEVEPRISPEGELDRVFTIRAPG